MKKEVFHLVNRETMPDWVEADMSRVYDATNTGMLPSYKFGDGIKEGDFLETAKKLQALAASKRNGRRSTR